MGSKLSKLSLSELLVHLIVVLHYSGLLFQNLLLCHQMLIITVTVLPCGLSPVILTLPLLPREILYPHVAEHSIDVNVIQITFF